MNTTKFSFVLTPASGTPTSYNGRLPDLTAAQEDDLLREIRAALAKAAGMTIELKRRNPPPGMSPIEK